MYPFHEYIANEELDYRKQPVVVCCRIFSKWYIKVGENQGKGNIEIFVSFACNICKGSYTNHPHRRVIPLVQNFDPFIKEDTFKTIRRNV